MKTIVLSIIVCFIFTTSSFAQIGFRGGANFAIQSYSPSATNQGFEVNGKIGYLLGVNYKIVFANTFGVRTGVEYALKGTKVKINGTEPNSNFDYLEIPIDVIYKSGNFSGYLGPYFAFLTSAKSGSLDLKPNYESLDIGLNVGFEFNIANIGIGTKYGLGLSNISELNLGTTSIKNNVLSVYVSFSL